MNPELLLRIGAITFDTEHGFVYASGKKGPIYTDNRVVLSYPKERTEVVNAFLALIEEKGLHADFIAGVATGAIAWASLIAEKLNKPLVYVRTSAKDHGKGNQIEGELEEGKSVLVVEDLINSGGSSVSACQAIQDSGCKVVACVAIFNYGFKDAGKLFLDAKVPLYSLTDLTQLLKAGVQMKAITEEQKKRVMEWHQHPKEWTP